MTLHVDLVRSATIPVASVTVTILDQTASTIALMAVPRDSSGNQLTGRVVTWSSSDATIAPIGATTGLVSVGASNGTVTITATCEGITGTMTVTVNGATPVATSLQWIDAAPTLTSIGATANSRAHVMDQFGSVFSPQPTITYTSSDTSKATVTSAGLVTAVANGTATITAASAGLTSITQTATVSQVVASITGVASTFSGTDADAPTTLSPVGKDANNNTVAGATITATSDQPSIVSVSGLTLTPQGPGTAHVTLASGGVTFIITCTISHALGLVITQSPSNPAPNDAITYTATYGGTDVTSSTAFSTSDPTVATVDPPTLTGAPSPASITQGTGPITVTFPCTNPRATQTLGGLTSGLSAGAATVVDSTHISFPITAASNAAVGTAALYLADASHGNSATQFFSIAASTTNLLTSPNDLTVAPWASNGNGATAVSLLSTTKHDGTTGNVSRIVADQPDGGIGNGSGGGYEQVVTISGGTSNKPFTVSCWARCETGTGNLQLKNTQGGVNNHFSGDLALTTTWQQYSFAFTDEAAAGTGVQRFGFQRGTGTGTGFVFYIDGALATTP